MKTVGTFFAALALAASAAAFALPAHAAEFTKGVVKKIDTKAKKVTIDHEDLKNLDMPAMTMVFRVGDGQVRRHLLDVHQRRHLRIRLPGAGPLRRRHARPTRRSEEVTLENRKG